MQDLLREINKLSAKINESALEESSSSKEGTVTMPGVKRMAKKRQRGRVKKRRGRKRYMADPEENSSSYTDCTDEDILKDYIDNLTANLSDSDIDACHRKKAFLVKRDLDSVHDYNSRWSPGEVVESDSFSESIFQYHSPKKRRHKRHSAHEAPQLHTSDIGMEVMGEFKKSRYKPIAEQYSNGKRKKLRHGKVNEMEIAFPDVNQDAMEVISQEEMQSSSGDESSTSEGSHYHSPGSEADDEGEESSAEIPSSCKISSNTCIIPWWEETKDDLFNVSAGSVNGVIEKSLSLIKHQPSDMHVKLLRCESKEPVKFLLQSGCFVAYANHKIRNFLQHRDTNELSLYTTNKKEQNQVFELSALYFLNYTVEQAPRHCRLVLTKTRNTREPNQDALKSFLRREVKLRYRKNRVPPQWNNKRRKMGSSFESSNGHHSEMIEGPISESNVGNQMLRNMGWSPGQGLGKDNMGILDPVRVPKRPRNLGVSNSMSML